MQLVSDASIGYAQGGCYRCRITGPVIDMDAHVEGEGTLAICPACIKDAADVALTRLPDDPIHAELESLRTQLAADRAQVSDAQHIITTLFQAWKRIENAKRKEKATSGE